MYAMLDGSFCSLRCTSRAREWIEEVADIEGAFTSEDDIGVVDVGLDGAIDGGAKANVCACELKRIMSVLEVVVVHVVAHW